VVRAYRVLYDLDPLDRLIIVGEVARRTTTTYKRRR
jgi:mRNA-degrading endonuclease RelE of RelBE toxin-antitoxin system